MGNQLETGLLLDSFGAQKPKEQSIPGKRSLVPPIQGTVSLEVSRGGWEGAEHEEKQEAHGKLWQFHQGIQLSTPIPRAGEDHMDVEWGKRA